MPASRLEIYGKIGKGLIILSVGFIIILPLLWLLNLAITYLARIKVYLKSLIVIQINS